jgi:hypothetical protein
MLKRFFLSLALSAGLLSPSFAAGTIPFSLSQQLDQFGKPLAGCQFYSIQAGTTSTPQNAYQDSALTLALPNPQTCDAAGRLPQMFFADGSIKVRLTDKNGVIQVVSDNIQVIGNSSGGGGGSPVDPTTILTTGDIKDTQALFQYLWGADANLTVSTGRGLSAAADWAANKQLTLPDFRSRALAGLGDMGNSDNALFSGVTFASGNSTTLGSLLGAARRTLLSVNLPAYTPTGSVATSTSSTVGANAQLQFPAQNGSGVGVGGTSSGGSFVQPSTFASSSTFTGTAQGGTSTPFDAISPFGLVTLYVKL